MEVDDAKGWAVLLAILAFILIMLIFYYAPIFLIGLIAFVFCK